MNRSKRLRFWVITVAVIAIFAISLIYKSSQFCLIVPSIENPNKISAIQVTESSSVYNPFVQYYTQEQKEIERFCSVLCNMPVSIKGIYGKQPTIQYSEKMYNLSIWTNDDNIISLVITDDGDLYYNHTIFSLGEKSRIINMANLLIYWQMNVSGQ